MPLRALSLAYILTALPSGCDRAPDYAASIGDVGVPAEVLGSLGEPERQILADIVGFSAALAHEEIDELGAPVVSRLAEEARAAALPYWLAAQEQGWGDAELRAAYEAQPEWELVVRHVVRLVEEDAPQTVRDSARRVAETVAERARAGEDFGALAGEFSQEPGAAERGGLLQPGRRGSWVDAFWMAAESLSPGQVSDVVQTEYGFHVLRLDERRPVPFDEASLTRLLRRIVPEAFATRAGEQWRNGPNATRVDSAVALTARDQIVAGEAVQAELVIATGGGARYLGEDLVAGWALLDPGTRAALEADDPQPYLGWVVEDARVVLEAAAAEAAGLDIPDEARADAEMFWLRNVATWAQAFAFAPGDLDGPSILGRSAEALLSGTPETRAARSELRSLRPRLRELYPVTADP